MGNEVLTDTFKKKVKKYPLDHPAKVLGGPLDEVYVWPVNVQYNTVREKKIDFVRRKAKTKMDYFWIAKNLSSF